jgi:thioesterase domain-containing protein
MNISEILKTIIPYKTLGMNVESESDDAMTLGISLTENLNDKKTMFAGSIYSAMVLCGWALAYKILNNDIKAYDVVIKKSDIKYLLPVKTDAQAIAIFNGNIITKKNGNKSAYIIVQLRDAENTLCSEFEGEYIGISK